MPAGRELSCLDVEELDCVALFVCLGCGMKRLIALPAEFSLALSSPAACVEEPIRLLAALEAVGLANCDGWLAPVRAGRPVVAVVDNLPVSFALMETIGSLLGPNNECEQWSGLSVLVVF